MQPVVLASLLAARTALAEDAPPPPPKRVRDPADPRSILAYGIVALSLCLLAVAAVAAMIRPV